MARSANLIGVLAGESNVERKRLAAGEALTTAPRRQAPPAGPKRARPRTVEEHLLQVVEQLPNEGLRPRVARLLESATEAIYHLQDLQLVPLGDPRAGAPQNLAAWEELAPVMAQTVSAVNQLLHVAGETFPAPPQNDSLDSIDFAFGPSTGETPPLADILPDGPEDEITGITNAVASGLRSDVARLGERLKNPSVVADPWNLVSDVLEFRGRLRAGVGELIFQIACTARPSAERAETVPGYAEDLSAALLLRQAATNLAFLFRGHARRVAGTSEERLQGALQDALRDVSAFSRTRALPALRTADLRIFLEARARLVKLAAAEDSSVRAGRETVENLARFFDSLSVISRRENLRVHDRAQLAAVGRLLEAAQESKAPRERAREDLVRAVSAAMALYGRDLQLDAYLRGQRHFAVDWLTDGEVAPEVERVLALLMGVAQP